MPEALEGRFHLRRVHSENRSQLELILLDEVNRFGRNADNVDVVLTSAVYSNMISRDHAIIRAHRNPQGAIIGYVVQDNSLNGTYINDSRVKDEKMLMENDTIKFGHMNGAAIRPGTNAPQVNAEFAFVFEKAMATVNYMGFDGNGRRRKTLVCQGNGTHIHEAPLHPLHNGTSAASAAVAAAIMNRSGMEQLHAMHFPPPIPPLAAAGDLNYMLGYNSMMQNSLIAAQQRLHLAQHIPPFRFPSQLPFMNGIMSGLSAVSAAAAHPPLPSSSSPSTVSSFTPTTRESLSSLPPSACVTPKREEGGGSSGGVGRPSTSSALRSPPMECDSSVPSPPKPLPSSCTAAASAASVPSAAVSVKDEEEVLSVPDSPPRAPAPTGDLRRSVTNSPAPSSPKAHDNRATDRDDTSTSTEDVKEDSKEEEREEEEKREKMEGERKQREEERRKEEEQEKNKGGPAGKKKKPVHPGKAPKGLPADKKANEVARLLSDLGASFEKTKAPEGPGSERRRRLLEGKSPTKAAVRQKGLMKQISDVSSGDDSSSDEEEDVGRRREGKAALGRKRRTSTATAGTNKRKKLDKRSKNESDSDESSDEEVKKGKKRKSTGKEKSPPSSPLNKKKKPQGGASTSKGSGGTSTSAKSAKSLTSPDFEDTEDTMCDMKDKCRQPKGSSIFWVCCDLCEKWYHNMCILGQDKKWSEKKQFFCGCNGKKKSKY